MNRAIARSILDRFLYLAGGIADLMLPDSCAACGAGEVADHGLCLNCHLKLLSLVALPYCRRCGASLGPAVPERDDGCRACPVTLPRFSQVIRLGSYADPLRAVCRDLKYRHQETLRRRLGRLLAEAVSARLADRMPEVVLAVPMHWRRRLGRPCDHARLLAGVLADCLHLPLGYELVRLRNTPPQVHLSRTKRIENVRGAFGLAPGRNWPGPTSCWLTTSPPPAQLQTRPPGRCWTAGRHPSRWRWWPRLNRRPPTQIIGEKTGKPEYRITDESRIASRELSN